MKLYAESSAVLAWLLGDQRSGEVGDILGSGQTITTSDLTLVECSRVLHRAVSLGDLSAAEAQWVQVNEAKEQIDRELQSLMETQGILA